MGPARGRKPGQPWACGRCNSVGYRAVLTVRRRPGCTRCRDVDDVLRLMWMQVQGPIAESFAFLSEEWSWLDKVDTPAAGYAHRTVTFPLHFTKGQS